MARQVLGALTTLNLATNLDPMFQELYAPITSATVPLFATNFTYTGTLTGGTGAIAIGTSQIIKDTSGNVGLGVSPIAGARLDVMGLCSVRSAAGAAASTEYAGNGGTFSATSLSVGQDSVGWGLVYQRSNLPIYFGTNNLERMRIEAAGNIAAGSDNTLTMGTAARRWSVVYAGTGTINTSDAREKTKVAALDSQEIAAAIEISKEIGAFKFLESVKTKGNDARIHIGMTVQRVMEIMRLHGLEPTEYAFICYEAWPEECVPAKTIRRETGFFDSANEPIFEIVETEPSYTIPAGDRYGFRADQLALFIARGQAQRQDELEARIAALEKP